MCDDVSGCCSQKISLAPLFIIEGTGEGKGTFLPVLRMKGIT